ncbi:FabD/lysophospholipase-like protein, partial [Aureobasidium melanogenum]
MYTSFEPPWEVTYLSDDVGVRVLSLDGGGMRGIMELEVLRAIEKSLGGNIRIQSFFDLIVGTSTGGINALALGVKQWSAGYCIEMFEKFCDQAFTEREFRGVWGLEQAALLNHGSKYKATPLHNVLKGTLGRSPLFGANDFLNAFKTKVAVTATSADGKEAMIFANYSRPQSSGDSQTFIRPGNPSNELEVWEAAAATSAAPFYFKPYTHTKTGTSYIDGGLYHNNPVHVANRERKLLWPAIANKHPDMLLSIGTGQNLSEQRREALERRASSPKDDTTPTAQTIKSGGIRRTFNALYQRFDNILDAEHTWTEFEADVNNLNDGFPSPYIRLNLDLKSKLPPFDAKDKFQEFRTEVRRRLKDPDAMRLVKDVACSLVASSFYFKLAKTVPLRGGSFMCTGYICCKFEEGSANLKALGDFLSKQCTPKFMPEFVIQDTSKCTDGRGVKVKFTEKIISRLITYGMLRIPYMDFEVPNAMASTTIALVLRGGCQDGTQKYLLSGFPRTLHLTGRWEDMEVLLKLQGGDRIFMGAAPQSIADCVKRLMLCRGMSITNSASDRADNDRRNVKINPNNRRNVEDHIPFASLIAGRYICYDNASLSTDLTAVEAKIKALRTEQMFRDSPTSSADAETKTASGPTSKAAKTSSNHALTATDLLDGMAAFTVKMEETCQYVYHDDAQYTGETLRGVAESFNKIFGGKAGSIGVEIIKKTFGYE